jgi:hypothetical protein
MAALKGPKYIELYCTYLQVATKPCGDSLQDSSGRQLPVDTDSLTLQASSFKGPPLKLSFELSSSSSDYEAIRSTRPE